MLREYQSAAIQRMRELLARGVKRIVLVAPTGAGKSVIAQDMVQRALSRGKRVLFVVNRIQLVKQFSERLAAAGIGHGVLRGEDSAREYEHAIVASIQTIAKRGLKDGFDLIVCDEAHAVPASKDYARLLAHNKNATVVGMTATPWSRGMGAIRQELGGPLFEEVVVAATYKQLIAAGNLVDCNCYAPSVPDLAGVRIRKTSFGDMDYVDTDLERAVNKPTLVGSIVEHWMQLARDTPTVVFATSIAHSKAIVESFNEAGVSAEHIDAYDDPKVRAGVLQRVDSGQTKVVSCVALLSEGWDQPSIRTMILARPTRSEIRYVQMVGRILRPFEGKSKATLLDHSGSVLRLGHPTDDRKYVLDDGVTVRKEQKRPPRGPTACPKCGFVDPHKSNPCEVCGHKREQQSKVVLVEGTLTKVNGKKENARQDTYAYLLWIAQLRKYKPGWAAVRYRKRFGRWPHGLTPIPKEPPPWFKALY